MKKILALLLALMMLMVTGICFAEAAEPECIQIWDIVAMNMDGEWQEEGTYTSISLFLFDDRSARLEFGENVYTGTVTSIKDPLAYLVTIGDNELSFVYDEENNTLSLTDVNGYIAVLAQRKDLPAETEKPECVEIWDIVTLFQDDVQLEEGTYPFISFLLYDDGSFGSELRGKPNTAGTYEMTNDPAGYIFTVGDQVMPLVYDEETGYLYMEANGQTGVFQLRTDVLNAESIDEFQGIWRINAMVNSGSLVHVDSAAGQEFLNDNNITDPTVAVEGTKVTFFGILEGEGELADGSLYVIAPYSDMIITLTKGDGIIVDIIGDNPSISKLFADKE